MRHIRDAILKEEHLRLQDTKSSMRHIRDVVLKERWYEVTTSGEQDFINLTIRHDDYSILLQDQVDLLGRLEVCHWRSSNKEDHYPRIATRI